MSAFVEDEKCREFGLDIARVQRIANRLASAATDARAMGLVIFGGSGTGSLRVLGQPTSGTNAAVAWLGEGFDGGDGGDA